MPPQLLPVSNVLSELELVTGFVAGQELELPRFRAAQGRGGIDPLAALEDAIRPAFARPPCVVAFSGGRDSSVLLAVAARLAQREGLDAPVAATLEYEHASTVETEWQERVLEQFEVGDWVRIPGGEEMDLVGPVAAQGLRRHGVLFPANAHTVVPMARIAAGGTLLTGVHGDDVFGRWPWHDVASLLAGRRRMAPSDIRRIANFLAPHALHAEIFRRRELVCSLPWLRPPLRDEVRRLIASDVSCGPRTWAKRLEWTRGRRAWNVTSRSVGWLGADEGALVLSPFLDPAFLAALATAGGRWGWGDRTETMMAVFGGVLPEPLLRRTTKAEFSGPLFGAHTKRFAQEWDGVTGIDPSLVDADALRAIWSIDRPHFLSSSLLQATWLACDRARRSADDV